MTRADFMEELDRLNVISIDVRTSSAYYYTVV